jgi:hypothetical protein
MSPKAPRIPESTWDDYKNEITALYTCPDGTLKKGDRGHEGKIWVSADVLRPFHNYIKALLTSL